LKRALKKRVKAVLKNSPGCDDAPIEQLNAIYPKAHRRTRTQFAMIGLAISMGATSLLVTRQSDQAHAATPVGSQTTASTIPAASETEVNLATTKVSVPENTVIVEPQVVSQVPGLEAKLQVAANGIAPVNNTTTNTANQLAGIEQQFPAQGSIITGLTTSTNSNEVDAQLKTQQELSLNRLQEKSNRLRNSLAQLRSEGTKVAENTTSASQANLILRLKQGRNLQTATATVTTPITYEVKPGDTLNAIASTYGISVSELVRINNLSNPNQLHINEKLMIPVVKEQQAPIAQSIVVPSVSTPTVAITPMRVPTVSVVASNTPLAPVSIPVPVIANGMGGDTPIPTAVTETQVSQQPKATKDTGLQSLEAEIERLRQKYRDQEAGLPEPVVPEVSTPLVRTRKSYPQVAAVPIPVPKPIQGSNYNTQPVQSIYNVNWSASEPVNPAFIPNQVVPRSGIRNSDSLGRLRGTTVSPQLPPLAAVDRYLPRPVDPATPSPFTSSVAYIWPAKGVLTSGYGMRWGRMHRGIDIANSIGTPVYASAAGVIERAGWNNGGYGNVVDIRHYDGSLTRYAHNSRILVRVGQHIEQGQQIAAMGSTGFSTGPHSHFEIHPPGKGAVNPIAFLPNRL